MESGSGRQSSVLLPSVPQDIGVRSQRQRILDAMAIVVAKKTFSAATIADLVGEASISRATFYKHFCDKRECFDVATKSFITELKDLVTAAGSSVESGPDAIRQAIAATLEQLAAKPSYANLALINAPILEPSILTAHRKLAIEGLKAQWDTDEARQWPGADADIAFGRAHVLIVEYLVTNRANQLPELLPEISYILLLPFLGHEMALAQAGSAE
jgi:AcrR family transcriptional regulator